MKKIILFFVLCVMTINVCFANGERPDVCNKFHFNVDLGFSPNAHYGFLDDEPLYEFSGSIYTGYQFNKCINAGVGIGYKYEYISSDCNSYGVPIFMFVKYDYMIDKRSPYVIAKFGYTVGDTKGVFVEPGFGMRFNHVNVGISYTEQFYKMFENKRYNYGHFNVNIGLTF